MLNLIRFGRICRQCTNGKCNEDQVGIEIECPSCNGLGCKACDDGRFTVGECPNKFCSDVANVAGLAELFYEGLPPVAGGVLDQSAWFVNAARFLRNEEMRTKAELNNG